MKALAGVLAALAVLAVAAGYGVAAADDSYAGDTYADASSRLSSYGLEVVVASRVGDELSNPDCIVTRSQKASWIKGDKFLRIHNTMLLHLNCGYPLAAPGRPGNSAASPEGRKAIKDQKAYVWKSTTEDGAEWCAENQKAHADWGASAFAGCPGT